jgi:hypothetical protein
MRRSKLGLALLTACYVTIAVLGGLRNCDRIYPDTICYLRQAQYLVEGRVLFSVSAYWSPIFSWCLAPLLWIGMDGLHAVRIVLAAWGAVLVVGAVLLTRRLPVGPKPLALACLLLVAVWVAAMSALLATPDVIVSACLLLYFYCVTSPRLLTDRRVALVSGALGGLSYLAKSYAFPFFLIHFVFSVFLAGARGPVAPEPGAPRHRTVARPMLRAWLIGMIGFLVVSAPWIALISWKHGSLTFSTAGLINHQVLAPPYVLPEQARGRGPWPEDWRLWRPPPGRLLAWETPEALPWPSWSPFADLRSLKHQLAHIARNANRLRRILVGADPVGLTLLALLSAPLLALLAPSRESSYRPRWVFGTVVLYASGYLLVFMLPRHVEPLLWPIGCIWCFHLLAGLRGWLGVHFSSVSSLRRKFAWGLLACLTVLSFSIAVGRKATDSIGPAADEHHVYRRAASDLKAAGCQGPVATTHRTGGLYVAYHMGEIFLGRQRARNWQDCRPEVSAYGVRTYLVWSGEEPAPPLDGDGEWELAQRIPLGSPAGVRGAILAYRRQTAPSEKPGMAHHGDSGEGHELQTDGEAGPRARQGPTTRN